MSSALRQNMLETDLLRVTLESHLDSPGAQRKWYFLLSYLIDFLIIFPVAILICFIHLDEYPVHHLDEIRHIRVIQEMKLSGNWLQPTAFGQPYFHKPPFKMWLSLIAVVFFGESNFSFRFLDALAGMGTAVLTYFFARRLLQSRVVGILSAVTLLGCHSYILDHGVRHAVQDSLLVFLTTLTLFCGWNFLETFALPPPLLASSPYLRSLFGSKQGRFWALTGGVVMGLAALTKNVASYMPLVIIGTYILLSGQGKIVWQKARWAPLIIIGLGFLLPASYLLPHCILDKSACSIMLGHEVFRRGTIGFHNQSSTWFYFNRIFEHGATVPAVLLLLGLVFALYKFVWPSMSQPANEKSHQRMGFEQRCYLFLFLWAVVPVILHTFIPSRLLWYVAPAFPGMSLIVGAFVGKLLLFLRLKCFNWWKGGNTVGVVEIGGLVFAFYAVGSIAQNVGSLGKLILSPPQPILMGALANDIFRFSSHQASTDSVLSTDKKLLPHQKPLHIIHYQTPRLDHHERLYLTRIGPYSYYPKTLEELQTLLSQPGSHFVITAASNFKDILRLRPIRGYRFLPPPTVLAHKFPRTNWVVLLSYQKSDLLKHFLPLERVLRFSELGTENLFYGWSHVVSLGSETIRKSKGSKSAFAIEADGAFVRLGTKIKMNIAHMDSDLNSSSLKVDIFLNNEKIGTVPVVSRELKTYEFEVPPETWMSGKNVFHMVIQFHDGQVIAPTDQLIAFNWIKIEHIQNP